jgi:hypothetical protein
MLTRARAAVVVLAGLTLAACGNVHPGAAAVVDGETISMKKLDETAKVYCSASLRQAKINSTASKPVNAEVRRSALTDQVSLIVARKLADKEGLPRPRPATYEVPDADLPKVAKAYPDRDPEVTARVIEDSGELYQLQIALGEKSTGQTATAANADQLAGAGEAAIVKAFKANDVKFAPRFGLSNSGTTKAPTTGSLSVAVTDLGADEPDDLPKAQRCS